MVVCFDENLEPVKQHDPMDETMELRSEEDGLYVYVCKLCYATEVFDYAPVIVLTEEVKESEEE